jgi:Domain of unknown function (DUF4157)
MEATFGTDFRDVRLHVDGPAADAARELNARAFTHKQNIFFGSGQFRPGTPEGTHLLAHELTHTVQQRNARSDPHSYDGGLVTPATDVSEREANAAAAYVASGRVVPPGTISLASGRRRRIARQPLPGTPTTPPGPAAQTLTAMAPGMQLTSSERIEEQVRGELGIENRRQVIHDRKILVKTESGAEAVVTISGTTDLPPSYAGKDPKEALGLRGRTGVGYTLFGRLADGTPVSGFGIMNSDDDSLTHLASTGPEFIHFGLTPERQHQAVVDALRNSVGETVWRESEKKGREQQKRQPQVQYPSQEEFEKMSREEKKSLAARKFWEEFSWENVLIGVLAGAAILAVAVLAILAAEAGLVALAIGLAAVAILAAVAGLVFLTLNMIRDVGDSWARGDYGTAILQILKYAALITAIIIGAVLLVLALYAAIAGAAITLTGLAIAAIVLLVLAIILGIVLVFVDLNQATNSDRVDDFQHYTKRAAREAEEVVINLILLIISLVLPAGAKRLSERFGKGAPSEGKQGGVPPEGKDGPLRIPLEGPEISLGLPRGGPAERITLPNGRNGLRLSLPSGESMNVEVVSRTTVPAGEVQRVRLPNGREGEIFVEPDGRAGFRWRVLSPEEVAALGLGEAGVRGTRPRLGAPTDPPRNPDGTIDYAAWEQRLRSKGIRGELARKIQEARAGNRDTQAELEAAERYADAGYDVEIVRPTENAGIRNPDLRITYRGKAATRMDVKFRESGKPLTRNKLNSMISDANDQLSSSPEARGDVLIDAREAAPDSMSVPEIENFLRGKLTGNRFAPEGAARLKNVEYLEITYRSGGKTHRSYMFRDANGNARGPFTEVLE